jgi:3-deoxy-manno-octulosonate cytidylyltransferase (CMP-KDO synthetase)
VSGFIVVIPSRYASTRLPGKPLKDIAGKPMIQWVYEQAAHSGATEVIVATDDERIAAACRSFGARVELTSTEHASGTDRIAELARRFDWSDDQIVVNVQGDEPLISPLCIAQTARLLAWHPQAAIATLVAPLDSEAEFRDPNFVKVVTDKDGWALYFSRAPIPWPREGALPKGALRHIGLYAYRAAGLKTISAAPLCALEDTEKLEQLRALSIPRRIS